MHDLHKLFKKKPYLAWYVADVRKLSTESLAEHVFNYGAWDDYLFMEKVLGIHTVKNLFYAITHKKRSNLRPKTINYFVHYFQKYA